MSPNHFKQNLIFNLKAEKPYPLIALIKVLASPTKIVKGIGIFTFINETNILMYLVKAAPPWQFAVIHKQPGASKVNESGGCLKFTVECMFCNEGGS